MQFARGDRAEPEPEGPEQTRDDTDEGWGEPRYDDRGDDRRLLEERPPHHDRW